MLDFVKQMFVAGCDIKPYLDLGTITQRDYDLLVNGSDLARQ